MLQKPMYGLKPVTFNSSVELHSSGIDLCESSLSGGVVIEVGTQPALHFGDGHTFAFGVVGDLVALDFGERKVFRLGMGEVKTADAGAGPHGIGFGDLNAGVGFDVEKTPDSSLLGVVGTGGVARRGTNATVFLVNEVVDGEVFGTTITPLVTNAFVEAFGEGFGEAISEGFGHDGVVVIVVGAETIAEFFEAVPSGDREGADVIRKVRFFGRDEISERAARLMAFDRDLLTKEVERGCGNAARVVGE